ncbi:leucine-rich repeat protein [Butyrivibrio sp. JL13D10]|uniref:leucine-rich repeat protein n=1 Tax=Butyrivibrio sp. JL13D10 TaxID=3236815 RepID=UPI0038B4F75B
MKKRVLAILMALSLVSTSVPFMSGTITASAEELEFEPAPDASENISNVAEDESEESGPEDGIEPETSVETQDEGEVSPSSDNQETPSSEISDTEYIENEEAPTEQDFEVQEPRPEDVSGSEETGLPSEEQEQNYDFNNDDVISDEESIPIEDSKVLNSTKNNDGESDYIVKPTICPEGYSYSVDASGKLSITGNIYPIRYLDFSTRDKVTSILLTGTLRLGFSFFSDYSNVRSITFNNVDFSMIEDMGGFFSGCKSLNSVDLGNINNTSKIELMYGMFEGCGSLTSLNLSGLDTSSATCMDNMFKDCSSLESIDISNFTISNKCSTDGMLDGCTSLYQIFSPKKVGTRIKLPTEFCIDNNFDGKADDNKKTRYITESSSRYINASNAIIEDTPISPVMNANGMLIHESNDKGGTGYVSLSINKSEFFKATTEYNHQIAKFACGLSTMAYSENTDTIRACFKDLGYKYSDTDLLYYKDQNGDTATYWIGNVPLDQNTVLITVLVRGTDGKEWYDNFEPGRDGIHKGFERGANKILVSLLSYMGKHDFHEKKIKLLVTGHSRGAAVANLVGYKIDNNYKADLFQSENTFVYTFATPNVSHVAPYERLGGYQNIYNIVNPEDFVTKVLPSLWGYGRYGYTFSLPSRSNAESAAKYNQYLADLRKDWKNYFVPGYDKTYLPYKEGMNEVTDYITSVTDRVWNINQYYDKAQGGTVKTLIPVYTLRQLYQHSLASIMSKDYAMGVTSFYKALDGQYGAIGLITSAFLLEHGAIDARLLPWRAHFAYGHQSETYMAAMNTVSEKELLRNKTMLRLIINCPVDIKVMDDGGNVVGEISDNEIITESTCVTATVEGDSKRVYIPGTGDYHIILTGNDNGTMDYTVSELECDTLLGPRIYYQDVPLTKGKEYAMDITGNDSINSYNLLDEDGNIIPKIEISETEIGNLNVDISVIGNGFADSFANLTPGDYVTLNAVAEEGNTFEGWYDESGNLLSSEAEYGISISESMKLTAKFIEESNANPSSGEEMPVNSGENEQGQPGIDTANTEQTQNAAVETAESAKSNAILPIGTEFTSAGKVYRINGDDTLALVKTEDKKAKTVSVPSNVVYENRTYSVTEINSKACKGMKKLKSVNIPMTVTKIGNKAFYNCPNLKKVTIKANASLTLGKSAFKKVSKDCTIKVKGLKKKAKISMVEKIKKQTNAKVK